MRRSSNKALLSLLSRARRLTRRSSGSKLGISSHERMLSAPLIQKLLYLDREFISAVYEVVAGFSPETKITKTEGLQASAAITFLSGGASSAESKSYSISTIGMLEELRDQLDRLPSWTQSSHDFGQSSQHCWVEGTLTINKVEVKKRKYTLTLVGKAPENPQNEEKLVAEEFYFAITSDIGEFALIPTADYFSSGISSFRELAGTVVGPIQLPVKALIRVFSAQTSFKQWLAVPLVIIEP